MNDESEGIQTQITSSPLPDWQSNTSPTVTETQSQQSDLLGSDQATLSGGSYHSANSLQNDKLIVDQITNANMASASSLTPYKSPINTTTPSASVLKHWRNYHRAISFLGNVILRSTSMHADWEGSNWLRYLNPPLLPISCCGECIEIKYYLWWEPPSMVTIWMLFRDLNIPMTPSSYHLDVTVMVKMLG